MFSEIPGIFLAAGLGWLAAGLVNYLADTLPSHRRLVRPYCLHCETPWRPGAAYLLAPGKCSQCGGRRSRRTWVVYLAATILSIGLWLAPPAGLGYLAGLVLVVYFGLVTVIDIEFRLILHAVSLVGAALGLVIGIYLHGVQSTLLGGLAGFGGMLAFYLLGIGLLRLLARWRGQALEESEALGFGDVNLSGVIGLMLGWPGIIGGLLIAILLGGLISLLYLGWLLLSRRYQPGLALPYGPFLAASALFLLLLRSG
jgi:leader peptidase (prepilin peptidase)/N-methyltransferase